MRNIEILDISTNIVGRPRPSSKDNPAGMVDCSSESEKILLTAACRGSRLVTLSHPAALACIFRTRLTLQSTTAHTQSFQYVTCTVNHNLSSPAAPAALFSGA